MAQTQTNQAQIEDGTIRIYRWGVNISFAFIVAGMAIALTRDLAIGEKLGNFSSIARDVFDLHPAGFIGVGIGVMILSPIVMLASATFRFLRQGDKRYAGLTGVVTAVLTLSIVIALLK